jgi:hypothetical protein
VGAPDRPIADQILAYLVEHPQAQDTLEGITEWWLLEQKIRSAAADVDDALRELAAEEFLLTRQCADGRTYYGLNRVREREIRRHLRSSPPAEGTASDKAKREGSSS